MHSMAACQCSSPACLTIAAIRQCDYVAVVMMLACSFCKYHAGKLHCNDCATSRASAVAFQAPCATLFVFKRAPNLLAVPTKRLAERVTLFMELPGLGRVRAAAILLNAPTLLALDAAVLASRWTALCTAANSHAVWAEQLAKYAASTVGNLLTRGERSYARLAWVVASGQQASIALSGTLKLDAKQFARRFPEYES